MDSGLAYPSRHYTAHAVGPKRHYTGNCILQWSSFIMYFYTYFLHWTNTNSCKHVAHVYCLILHPYPRKNCAKPNSSPVLRIRNNFWGSVFDFSDCFGSRFGSEPDPALTVGTNLHLKSVARKIRTRYELLQNVNLIFNYFMLLRRFFFWKFWFLKLGIVDKL